MEANLEGESLAVSHETDDGLEKFSVALPAVIAAQQGLAEPRYPSVRDVMQARRKPIERKAAEVSTPAAIEVVGRELKGARSGGRIVEGETVADAVAETARLLRSEAKVL